MKKYTFDLLTQIKDYFLHVMCEREITCRERKYRDEQKRVMYILCANDRFNYGDLLFPFIIRFFFKNIIDEFIICSTTTSDMSETGALPTTDFSIFKNIDPTARNILMIGGGECLFCEWDVILEYVKGERAKESVWPTKYPFTIGKNELKGIDTIIYNSVGGHQIVERQEILRNVENRSILSSVDYISVRDKQTSFGLKKMKVNHVLCADSAILMSEIFDDSFLNAHSSSFVESMTRRKYLFFQIGLQHLKDWKEDYAQILEYINKKYSLHICMCPIGLAYGHDDPKAIKEIADLMPLGIYTIIERPSIWDIMNLIRQSKIYVGSSLHGAITAMSYDVPLIGFGPRKLQLYIETWYDTIRSECSFVAIDNLRSAIERRLESRFTISAKEQKCSVKKSFKRMQKFL